MNKQALIVGLIGLSLGLGGGYAAAQMTESSTDKSVHNDTQHSGVDHGTGHGHDMFMVSAKDAPTIEVDVTEDAKSGWNIKLDTTNFIFTPEKVNGENVVGEGHAHLYVDGEKIARLYGPNFHYGESFDDTKTFRVTLNANDHSEYAVDGEVIEATQEVTHKAHN